MRHSPTNLVLTVFILTLVASTLAQNPPTTIPATAAAREVDPAVAAFLQSIEPSTENDPLRQRLIERHNTAVRLLQAHIERYRTGVADASAIFEAAREVADAKMGLARDAPERLAIAREVLEVSRAVESRVEKQWKAGLGPEINLLRARLARETAEIELLKLQQQQQQSNATTAPATQKR